MNYNKKTKEQNKVQKIMGYNFKGMLIKQYISITKIIL